MTVLKKCAYLLAIVLALSLRPASANSLPKPAAVSNGVLLQEMLFNLPLAYSLTDEVLDLYDQTSRSTDFILLTPQKYGLAGQVNRGHLMCLLEDRSFLFDLPSMIPSRCEYICLQDNILPEQVRSLRLMTDMYRKKIALSPEAGQALADGAQLIAQIAPYAHLLIIQAGQWLEEDTSPSLETFLANVHTVASRARAANPEIHLQVQLGNPESQQRLTADKFFRGLSRLAEANPDDLHGCYISRLDAWDNPEQGNNLLVQALTFLRGESYSPPGVPEPPRDFRAAALDATQVLLSWTDVSSAETGYLLKREQGPDRPPLRVSELPSVPDLISFQDTVPAAGSYYYRLCAFNAKGLSLFSPLEALDTRGGKANLPPRILSVPQTAVFQGVPFEYAVSAFDPDGDPLTYSLSLRPAGMLINPQTGLITWLPAASGRYYISLTVSDGQSAGFQWFEVEVKDAGSSGG
ncbi:MAG TPA: putative Ig domain-containing protein [Acidobacteriota bacterium]